MAGPGEQVFVGQSTFDRAGRLLASPFQFTTTGDDNLRVVSVNSKTGVALKIQGRRLDENGKIQTFAFDHVPNTDRTVKTTNQQFGAGALLNLTVFASSGTPLVGQTFVIVQLIRGLTGATIVLGTLLQGYVTTTQGLGWPGSPIVSSTEGEPAVRVIDGTTPAAGVNFSETVPTGARWELLSCVGVFVTSAAPGQREVFLILQDSVTNFVWRAMPGIIQNPSQTFGYQFSAGTTFQQLALGTQVSQSIPSPNVMLSGMTFRSGVVSLSPGDQFSDVHYVVREWLEVP